jgi:predicted transcriptional regulator
VAAMTSNDDTKSVTLRLPADVVAEFDQVAREQRRSRNAAAELAFMEYVERHQEAKKRN